MLRWARALALIVSSTLLTQVGVADDATAIEEVRQDVRDLKAQVEALRETVTELAERTKKGARHSHRRRRSRSGRVRTGTLEGKVDVPSGEPVAYVYVENVRGSAVHKRVSIEQKEKRFVPSWAVVRRGTTIAFPNYDNIHHSVISLSSGNAFELGLESAEGPAKSHTFNAPGVVDVYCNLHPKMAASVLIVPNRLFAKVRADGTFTIEKVPRGQRKIVAWSPGAKLASRWVQIGKRPTAVELTLEPRSSIHRQ